MTVPHRQEAFERASDLAFAQTGRGPDVILIHGAMTALDDMAIALFASLEDEFRVTAFDRPGHGRNHAPFSGSPARQADLIHEAAQALGLERPVIVGHSFGGAVALAYAQRHPEDVAGVVALSPIAFPEPRLEQVLFGPRVLPGPLGFWNNSLGRLADPILLPILWRAMFLPQAVPERFAEVFPFKEAGRANQMLAEGQDANWIGPGVAWNALNYPSCATPVHVFSGDSDIVINPRLHAVQLNRLLPNSRLTMLPGLGHMIHHFAQPPIVDAIRMLSAKP